VENLKKVTYLVNLFETYLDDIGDLLRDINEKLGENRLSSKWISYARRSLWQEPAAEWSTLISCKCSLDAEGNMHLRLEGTVPQLDSDMRVMQARAFKFWNRTTTGDYCWMRYAGPRYVLANVSSNCFADLDANLVTDNSVTGVLCDRKNQTRDRWTRSSYLMAARRM